MNLTYATILFSVGEEHQLYREARLVKRVTRIDSSNNAPMYSEEKYFSCFMLEEDDQIMDETQVECFV